MRPTSAANERGQNIGNSNGAFLWQNGSMVALGTLPGQQFSGAVGINDRGQVVGTSGSSFRNDRGEIVGWCGGRQGEDRHTEHAALWAWESAR